MSAAAATVSIRWRAATTPSATDRWHTPEALYLALEKEFSFTIDVAADEGNAKCDRFVDREQDALSIEWAGETVFCNPPYGRELTAWIEKGMLSAQDGGATVVMLLPARTGNRWFHRYCLPHAEIRFVQGRLNFQKTNVQAKRFRSPFDSMVVIFRPWSAGQGKIRTQPTFPGFSRV
jgi:site-specific DNA-methyltransferase (adenine-specific)